MATLKELRIALDDMLFLTGVHRSMRCNAIEYQVRLAEGQSPEEVAIVARKNLDEYKRLLQTRQEVRDDPALAKELDNGLLDVGIDKGEHQTMLDALLATADDQLAKPLQTEEDIKALVADTLTKAPAPILVDAVKG
jgi:hypothetical protein